MADSDMEPDESLIALTTHFAQVQFRLKQIISADPQHKESLLEDLEEFAFQGCSKPMTYDTAASGEHTSTEAQRRMRSSLMEKLQNQLTEIERCAKEATVSEEMIVGSEVTGISVTNTMLEKQKIIIEELRKRFDVQFGNLEELSAEEVKHNVEKIMSEVVDPIKSKEEYVSQLQNQIVDLERYISFLQDAHPERHPPPIPPTQNSGLPLPRSHDSYSKIHVPRPRRKSRSHDRKSRKNKSSSEILQWESLSLESHESSVESHDTDSQSYDIAQPTVTRPKKVVFAVKEDTDDDVATPLSPLSRKELVGPLMPQGNQPVPNYRLTMTQLDGVDCALDSSRCEWGKKSSLGDSLLEKSVGPDDLRLSLLVMKKTLAVMQVLTLCQCGGSFQCLPKYMADGRQKNYHGALHTLEESVDKIVVITTALSEAGISVDTRVSLETDLHETVSMSLADSLRILLEHGLIDGGRPISINGGCFPNWRRAGKKWSSGITGGDCPAWKVFKHYYTIKSGKQFSSKTDQLLACSFDIPMATNTSMKKTLLSSIHRVETAYQDCHHRAHDTKFRALICEGFNVCHLAEWFRILSTHPSIADDLYSITSFLATTGYRPALGCLERLKDNPVQHKVSLPRKYYHCPEAYQPSRVM